MYAVFKYIKIFIKQLIIPAGTTFLIPIFFFVGVGAGEARTPSKVGMQNKRMRTDFASAPHRHQAVAGMSETIHFWHWAICQFLK